MANESIAISAVLGVDLVAQLVAAAEPLPAEELADRRPNGTVVKKASAGYLPVW